MDPLRFYFVRHAKPLVPKGYSYGGMEEVPLNMTGPKTLRALDAVAGVLPADFLAVSSPSPRARVLTEKTLELKQRPSDGYVLDARFLEQNWGKWQGKMYSEIPPHELASYHEDENNRAPPGGESLDALLERVSEGMDDYAAQYTAGRLPLSHVFVGCHGGVIRAALAHAEGRRVSDYLKQPVRRLSLTVIDWDPANDRWTVEGRNLTLNAA